MKHHFFALLPAVAGIVAGGGIVAGRLNAVSWKAKATTTRNAPPTKINSNAADGRVRLRFDDNWRFLRDTDAPKGLGTPVSEWQWKPAGTVQAGANGVTQLPGDIAQGDWQTAKIGQDVFQGAKAYAWFRATLGDFPASKGATRLLRFEAVDDNAVVFLNGKLLTLHSGWNEPFAVPLDDAWNPDGPNQIVVLVENTAGSGGISGNVSAGILRPDTAPAQAAANFDDSKWATVHLPHDYIVEGTFNPGADTAHGSLPVMPAWYRKQFVVPASDKGKTLWLDFDGVYRKSRVYLNSKKIGENPSGYIGARYDITQTANVGGANTLLVEVDPRQPEGWWYEGGGIYRHVWLNAANPVHVAPEGVVVRSDVRDGTANPAADIHMETEVANDTKSVQNCVVISRLVGPDNKEAARVRTNQTLPAGEKATVRQDAALASAALWTLQSPRLYRLETTVSQNGRGNRGRRRQRRSQQP